MYHSSKGIFRIPTDPSNHLLNEKIFIVFQAAHYKERPLEAFLYIQVCAANHV